MKKFFIFLLGLSLLVSISCSNNFNRLFKDTSISIALPFQGREAWSKSDITSYKITLTSDADENITQTQTATPEKPTVTFQELEPGTYSIQALAYSEETEVAGGQTKVTVEEGQNATATIKMTLYQTKNGGSAAEIVTITLNSNYEGGPAEVQWKDVKPENVKVIKSYNTVFPKDERFRYGIRKTDEPDTAYCFCGWSVGKPAEAPYDDDTILQLQDLYNFTEDTTLYAVWCEESEFVKSEGNFTISYKLSSEDIYNVCFLKSHRDSFITANVELLFPEFNFPSPLKQVWEPVGEGTLTQNTPGTTFSNISFNNALLLFTFPDNSYKIRFIGDAWGGHGSYDEVITDFTNCDYSEGYFRYLLPTSLDSFDGELTIPDGLNIDDFKFWSVDGDEVDYIYLNNVDDLVTVYANWESAFLKNQYDVFYKIIDLGEQKFDATSESYYFEYSISTIVLGNTYMTHKDDSKKIILENEKIDNNGLTFEVKLAEGGYLNDIFNNIKIVYVTDNGIICSASANGKLEKFYLATQAQYDAALDSQKLFIISENPSSSEDIDRALAAYNN